MGISLRTRSAVFQQLITEDERSVVMSMPTPAYMVNELLRMRTADEREHAIDQGIAFRNREIRRDYIYCMTDWQCNQAMPLVQPIVPVIKPMIPKMIPTPEHQMPFVPSVETLPSELQPHLLRQEPVALVDLFPKTKEPWEY